MIEKPSQQTVVRKPAEQSRFYEMWVIINIAARFFLGACIVWLAAITISDIRHDVFNWENLASGLLVIVGALLVVIVLGRIYGKR